MTGREAALTALRKMRRGGQFSEAVLDEVISAGALDAREAALCSRIVWSAMQNLYYLDFVIGRFTSKSLDLLDPAVLDVLRVSAAQILYLDRVPDSAAVNTGVELCKSVRPRAAGLVNAALRRVSERKDALPEVPGKGTERYLSIKYSHPGWLTDTLIERQGYDFTEAFFIANNTEPPLSAQVNTLKTDAHTLSERLTERGIDVAPGALPDSLELRGTGKLTELAEFRDGLFYVQDEAARRAVIMSGVEPGMKLLDACAAPGGKSFAAALMMKNEGRIIACDIAEKKLRLIKDGAQRLGIDMIETRQMDARKPDAELLGWADAVIADCPCSGLGVIRKKPDIRFKHRDELSGLPRIQSDILDALADCVRPGGALIYSTCTILREENENVVEGFLNRRSDFHIKESAQFWPHIHGTDGFFVCSMLRSI